MIKTKIETLDESTLTPEEIKKLETYTPPMIFRFLLSTRDGQEYEDLEVKYHLFDRGDKAIYSEWETIPIFQVVTEAEIDDRERTELH